jgi:tetratricopeptide (TPR) repeat protein
LCQLFNLVAARAETFETYGNLYRELGEIERAVEYYDRAARAYDEAGIALNRTELLEERALLSLQIGDFSSAQAQIDRLLSARPQEKDELAFFTASLTRDRIMTARSEYGLAHQDLSEALEYFHSHGLYYYEAQASAVMALCALQLGKEPEMLNVKARGRFGRPIRLRVLAKAQIAAHPELFH